jgi:hypothetical protein
VGAGDGVKTEECDKDDGGAGQRGLHAVLKEAEQKNDSDRKKKEQVAIVEIAAEAAGHQQSEICENKWAKKNEQSWPGNVFGGKWLSLRGWRGAGACAEPGNETRERCEDGERQYESQSQGEDAGCSAFDGEGAQDSEGRDDVTLERSDKADSSIWLKEYEAREDRDCDGSADGKNGFDAACAEGDSRDEGDKERQKQQRKTESETEEFRGEMDQLMKAGEWNKKGFVFRVRLVEKPVE